jgi:acyl transferase domain-containing protein
MLKTLDRAEADGDRIYGVIKGWGVNQDGSTNGITAPSDVSQSALQRSVYDRYGIDPGRISYVEAHGTGTKLGDPIEVTALKESFRHYTQKTGYCGLGSVKTNIGHTTATQTVGPDNQSSEAQRTHRPE